MFSNTIRNSVMTVLILHILAGKIQKILHQNENFLIFLIRPFDLRAVKVCLSLIYEANFEDLKLF